MYIFMFSWACIRSMLQIFMAITFCLLFLTATALKQPYARDDINMKKIQTELMLLFMCV